MSGPIKQEVVFNASPRRVYEALTDSEKFAAFSGGAPADISPDPGGLFSCFGGRIEGRNLELVPDERVVQAWRAGNWDEGVYSIARFELKKEGSATRLVFEHSGFPEDQRDQLAGGWEAMYWGPLGKYLG